METVYDEDIGGLKKGERQNTFIIARGCQCMYVWTEVTEYVFCGIRTIQLWWWYK